jgi:hypothetical protein
MATFIPNTPVLPTNIRTLPLERLESLFQTAIPPSSRPSNTFFCELSTTHRTIAYRMCLLTWAASEHMQTQICPREWQIRAATASLESRSSIVNVGTGQGKTLCGILAQFLDPGSISVIISPLKRLMAMQVKEYGDWGLRAAAINEDTSREKELWKVRNHQLSLKPFLIQM